MPLIDETPRGVFVVSVTPFHPVGEVDWNSTDRVRDLYLDAGADGLTIFGMMGEAPKLTQHESIALSKRIIARAAGKPVVVGVSAPWLAAVRELAATVMNVGAAGVMVALPGSLSNDAQIHDYYGQVVETLGPDVPVVL